MWNLKRNDTNQLTYKTERNSWTWKMNLRLPGEKLGSLGRCVHTAVFRIDSHQGPVV